MLEKRDRGLIIGRMNICHYNGMAVLQCPARGGPIVWPGIGVREDEFVNC